MRRPRLTAKIIDALADMSSYARADAEAMGGTEEEDALRERIESACVWVDALVHWYRAKHSTVTP